MSTMELAGQIEPFDSFWEGPANVEKGYRSFAKFYRYNYLKHLPSERDRAILAISCGPGYFVDLLRVEGYENVLGIDSDPTKVRYAQAKGLNCRVERAFPFLEARKEQFDVIFCEQELNHLTKTEMLALLRLCRESLRPNGVLIVHSLNGANPITGSEALAQNFDHYHTMTENTFMQVLLHLKFVDIKVFPLNLYVFWTNPLNYVLIAVSGLLTLGFRLSFIMYGKSNKIFTKKIGAVCRKPSTKDSG